MATTLVDKRLLDYKDKETKNVPLNELYVTFNFASEEALKRGSLDHKTKKLSELFVKEQVRGKEIHRPLKSYEEFVKLQPKGVIYTESTCKVKLPQNGEVAVDRNGNPHINRTEPFYEDFSVDKQYQTVNDVEQTKLVNSTRVVTKSAVPYGLTRTAKVNENNLSNEDNYLLVHFEDSSKQDFIKKSKIYYREGETIVYLYESGKNIDFARAKGKTLFYENQVIDNLYTEKEYTFGELSKFETIDSDKLKKNSYELIQNPTEEEKQAAEERKDGIVKLDDLYYKEVNSTSKEKYLSIANQVDLEVADPYSPGKYTNQSYYAVKIYCANKTGDYVNLRIKGDNKASMIKIDKLFTSDGKEIAKSNILNYVGKSICVKDENGKLLETDALTAEQASYFYEKQYNYDPAITKDAVLSDNSYLQTQSGEYVKEQEVIKPISYRFTDSANPDAYLIHMETKQGVESKVVTAVEYKNARKNLKFKEAYPLESSDFNNAQVVQTSNNNKLTNHVNVQECKVLCNYDGERKVFNDIQEADKEQIKTDILNKFNQDYKAGDYMQVGYFYDENGNKVKLKERGNRFVYTDSHYMRDYAADKLEYMGLKDSTVTYEYKDGELGKFKGNVKVDFKKTCSKAYGKWAKALVYYLGASVSPAGLLASLAAPWLMPGIGIAIAALPVIIPVVVGGVCFSKNVLRGGLGRFKDKTEHNRIQWNKDIEKELEFINNNMKETKLTKGFSKDAFLARMAKLKMDALATCQATVGNGFQVVDGVVQVNGENVNEVKKFKQEHKKELKELKAKSNKLAKLKEKVEKASKPFDEKLKQGIIINENDKRYKKYLELKKSYDDYRDIYQKQEDKFNRNVKSRNDEAKTYGKDSMMDKNLQTIETLTNFWMLKKFTSKEKLTELGFTDKEIEKLSKLDYSVLAKYNAKVEKDKKKEDEKAKRLANKANKKDKKAKETEKESAKDEKKEAKKDKKLSKREINKKQNEELLNKLSLAIKGLSEDKEAKEQVEEQAEQDRLDAERQAEQARQDAERQAAAEKQAKEDAEKQKAAEIGKENPVKEVAEPKEKVKKAEKAKLPFNAKINSEKALASLLKANVGNVERQKVVNYISKKAGVNISESDIKDTLERIEDKHDSSSKEGKTATSGAQRLKNKNIYSILIYGQQYITEYEEFIRNRAALNSDTAADSNIKATGKLEEDKFMFKEDVEAIKF